MSDKLKPCPICNKGVSVALGGDKKTYFYFVTRGMGKDACKCRLFMESKPFFKDTSDEDKERIKNDLIKQWNIRKPIDRIVEELEEQMNDAKNLWDDDEYYTGKANAYEHSIEIVKAGGIDGI